MKCFEEFKSKILMIGLKKGRIISVDCNTMMALSLLDI